MITPHLQTMATSLYGFLSLYPAIRLTNQEYKLKTEEEVDVQSQLRNPRFTLMAEAVAARQQLESRLCCLQHLQRNLHTEKLPHYRKLTLHEINENFYNPR